MNKLALLSAVFVFIVLSTAVYAETVAYVVKNPLYPDHNFVNALTAAGFTVTLVDDHNAASTNFSNYDLILVGDEMFVDPSAIPVKNHPSVVANTYYADDCGFATGVGSYAVGNGYLKGKIVTNNTITIGLPNPIQLFNAYGIQAYTLPKIPDRSRD
jgi:hypothetical protein